MKEFPSSITERHSVRRYLDTPIAGDALAALNGQIADCNAAAGLNIQLITDEPAAFGGLLARYGRFSGVRNYIALVGKKSPMLDELCGYYGEKIVLYAQSLGLNTCWVYITYSKGECRAKVGSGERLACLIAIGYGENQGVQHRSKPLEAVCGGSDLPKWFIRGVECALLAPTAVNRQAFRFTLIGSSAVLAEGGRGHCAGLDLGIVKLHFELGAGKENFTWAPN